MADKSIPSRELDDGSIEVFEDGRWLQIAPAGSFRERRIDAGSALLNAALRSQEAPQACREAAVTALKAADAIGQRTFAIDYALRGIAKLKAKGSLRTSDAAVADEFIGSMTQ